MSDFRTAWRKRLRNELARHPAMYRVLSALADYGDPSGGSCRPTVETLTRKARTSRRTVLRALKWARETGWIEQVYRGSRVRGRASLYVLRMGTTGTAPDYSREPSIGATVTPIETELVAPIAWGNRCHGDTPPLSSYQGAEAPSGPSDAARGADDLDAPGAWTNTRSDGQEPLAHSNLATPLARAQARAVIDRALARAQANANPLTAAERAALEAEEKARQIAGLAAFIPDTAEGGAA